MNKKKAEGVYYRPFQLPADFPLVALLGDQWTSALTELVPVTRMHFHNCYEIGYLYQGSGTLFVEDEAVSVSAPGVIVIPPNRLHETRSNENDICHWNWFYVDPLQLLTNARPRIVNDLDHLQTVLQGQDCVLQGVGREGLYQLLSIMIHQVTYANKHYHKVVADLMDAFFMVLLRMYPDQKPRRTADRDNLGIVTPAVHYISQNYMTDVSVSQLAQMCHISVSHFRRLFKQMLGWAPQEYLQIVRIERACELLYNCDYSVTEIAMRVGYESPTSLTRHFNKVHGIAPNQWRKKIRSEENPAVTAYFSNQTLREGSSAIRRTDDTKA